MPSDRVEDRPRRLHPASLAFTLGALLRQLVFPALVVIVASRGDGWQRWLLVPFVFLLGIELVKCLTLSYRFTADELVIRSGLLSRTERHIPFERVQNIELVANALHRMVGVVEVRLQTGSGAKVEAHLRVISTAAAEELKSAIGAARGDARSKPEPSAVLLRMPLSEVALHGLLTSRGLVALAAILGVVSEYDFAWESYVAPYITSALEGKAGLGDELAGSTRAVVIWVAVFVPAVIFLRLASTVWAVVRLYGFTLERAGDGLHSHYGLLTRVSATIPRARVQVLSVQEGTLHRWLRRASVRVDTAAQFKHESRLAGLQWIAPIVRTSALLPLVREVQPDADIDPPEWWGVHPRAFTRLVRLRLVLVFAATLGVGVKLGAVVVVPALLVGAFAVWQARRLTRRLGVALTDTSIVTRTGAFTHRRFLARYSRIQSVSCTRSPFDRRWGMASISVDTAGVSLEHRIVIRYLPVDRAMQIYERLCNEAARSVRG